MDASEVLHDSMLPLSWIPTRGNDIPPCAVPALEGQYGPLYIARAFVEGEMQLGTTSHLSISGARIIDSFGRKHVVLEYEVLACATSLRWDFSEIVDTPMTGPSVETHAAMRSPLRQANTSFSNIRSPLSPHSTASTPKLPPQDREVFSPVDQPRAIPGSSDDKKYPIDPPPSYSYNSDSPKSDSWVDVPTLRRPIMLNKRENIQFHHLVGSHCFILIDDSLSMQRHWTQARDAVAGVAVILSSDEMWRGANIRFLHHPDVHRDVRTLAEFNHVFNSVTTWNGNKAMAPRVMQVFLDGLPLVQQTAQPVNLLIITDGIAIDSQDLFDKIIRFSHQLDQQRVQPHMFRIHILQMGEDRKVVQPLHDFRDRVAQRDHNRHILNVVSYHRARGLLDAQIIMRLLLASTYIPNEEDPDVPQRLPPAAVRSQYVELDRIRALGNSRG